MLALRLTLYFILTISYYTIILPNLRTDLHDPEVTTLSQQRLQQPLGGVLRFPPTNSRLKAHSYGESKPPKGTFAYVLILWSDDYVLPACVLVKSLTQYGTSHDIHLLVPQNGKDIVSLRGIQALEMLGARVTKVSNVHDLLQLPKSTIVSPMFLKLHAWTLTVYDRILLLDADTLAVTNFDPLLFASGCMKVDLCTASTATPISAPTSRLAQDIGVANYFNAGFLHIKPSIEKFNQLVLKAKETKFVSQWAYEQDFLNQMVHLGILTHASIRPVGHFNKYPATRLIHYTSGKPWGWRSYPIHVPWTPRRKYWGIVRSFAWISTRYTLPGSFSLLTTSALLMVLYPIIITALLSKELYVGMVGFFWNGKQNSRYGETKTKRKKMYNVLLVSIVLLWTLCIGAPRLKYDPGWLLPARMPPTTAWIVLLLNTTSVVSCCFPGLLTLLQHLYIFWKIMVALMFVTLLEIIHINTSPWGMLVILLSGLLVPMYQVRNAERELVKLEERRSRLD